MRKVADLTGRDLDYAVMIAQGWRYLGNAGVQVPNGLFRDLIRRGVEVAAPFCYSDSKQWWLAPGRKEGDFDNYTCGKCSDLPYRYTTDIVEAWPLISQLEIGWERTTLANLELDVGPRYSFGDWQAKTFLNISDDRFFASISYGPDKLTAAMRCYVVYHMGEMVDVPEGLPWST